MSYLKQNDGSKFKEARLYDAVIWLQYLHPENVNQTIFPCSLACKKEKKNTQQF